MSFDLGHLHGGLHCSVVDRLKDHRIDLEGFIALEDESHDLEGISETLNANTDGSVAHVRVLSLYDWVVVAVDHTVQVLGDTLGHAVE